MDRSKKQLKEAEELVKLVDLTDEEKKEYHEAQVSQFNKVIYRLWADIQVAKQMIAKGNDIGEEAYVTQGENNIQEAVSQMRGAALQLEKQRDLLKKLK